MSAIEADQCRDHNDVDVLVVRGALLVARDRRRVEREVDAGSEERLLVKVELIAGPDRKHLLGLLSRLLPLARDLGRRRHKVLEQQPASTMAETGPQVVLDETLTWALPDSQS